MSNAEELLAEIRRHHRTQVNQALRRPGMYGPHESSQLLLLDALAVAEGRPEAVSAAITRLREDGAYTTTGTEGAYRDLLPAGSLRSAGAALLAEVAHRLGWLDLDRTLPDLDPLRTDIGDWIREDHTESEVIARYGKPSMRVGGSNPYWPKTLLYGTDRELVAVHVWNEFVPGEPMTGVHPEPMVLAVRHRPGAFRSSLSFTPEGIRHRDAGFEPTVWVFHAEGSPHASAVFERLSDGLHWANRHQATGILAEHTKAGAVRQPREGLRRVRLVRGGRLP